MIISFAFTVAFISFFLFFYPTLLNSSIRCLMYVSVEDEEEKLDLLAL